MVPDNIPKHFSPFCLVLPIKFFHDLIFHASHLHVHTRRRDKLLRCYAMAALANATANPLLAGRIKELKGVDVIERIDKQNDRENSLEFGGTRITECAEIALARLNQDSKVGRDGSDGGSGGAASTISAGVKEMMMNHNKKFTFKWGNTPVMELTLDSNKNRWGVVGCLVLWFICIFLVLQPVLRPPSNNQQLLSSSPSSSLSSPSSSLPSSSTDV